ncbi:hypothetical protein KKC06_06280 [Patescibacteria group bacterium]|nr:hypothetical protein [Patescibacteria group bacterium]
MNTSNFPQEKQNTGWVIVLHFLVIIILWSSPFLFRWPLIILGIIAYYLQLIFIGDCILTRQQFDVKKRSITFYYFLLKKIGFNPSQYRVRFASDYIMPWIILGIAFIWQIILNKNPLII